MTLSGLLDRIYNNAYNIIIGKFFAPAQVGFFTQAETMRLLPVGQIGLVIGKVTYPLFANIKTDVELKNAYKKTMKLVLSIVIPMMLILILVAEDFFLLLFGEKWLPAVPYFQILAIASIIRPISSYNLNILKVKGRSDLFLKVEVIKKVIGVIAIAIGLPFGVMGLVISLTTVSFLFTTINMLFCGKLIDYPLVAQVKDIFKLFMIGVIAYLLSYVAYSFLILNIEANVLIILAVSLLFALLYLPLVWFFEKSLVIQLRSIIKKQDV